MLPIHGIISDLPPLLFHSDMYKLLFYSHYEPVSSTGNGSSGSGTALFSLFYPQILITVLGIQEGSQNLLTASGSPDEAWGWVHTYCGSGLKGVDLGNVYIAPPGNYVRIPHTGFVILAQLFTR